ncbi:MAG: hypothetical protein KGJ45_12170, partial [Elusimicrobia bacterium]|nr:hypothetical protein [Elusimicrobiota bacterium]
PGLLAYATNGANSVPAALSQLVQNKDYAGRPIYGTTAARGALGDWAREQAMPISVEIQKERLKGSNIGSVEAMLGARTAPAYLSGVSSARYQHYQQAAQRMNERARARKKAMYEQ